MFWNITIKDLKQRVRVLECSHKNTVTTNNTTYLLSKRIVVQWDGYIKVCIDCGKIINHATEIDHYKNKLNQQKDCVKIIENKIKTLKKETK